jgi:putative flippase GtrA
MTGKNRNGLLGPGGRVWRLAFRAAIRPRAAAALVGGPARLAELARFATVGGSAAAIYFTVVTGLTALGWPLTAASVVAYVLGAASSFFGHRAFTFGSRGPLAAEARRFALLNTVGFAIALAMPVILTEGFGVASAWAIVVTCVIAPTINYLALRSLVFVKARLPKQDLPSTRLS